MLWGANTFLIHKWLSNSNSIFCIPFFKKCLLYFSVQSHRKKYWWRLVFSFKTNSFEDAALRRLGHVATLGLRESSVPQQTKNETCLLIYSLVSYVSYGFCCCLCQTINTWIVKHVVQMNIERRATLNPKHRRNCCRHRLHCLHRLLWLYCSVLCIKN